MTLVATDWFALSLPGFGPSTDRPAAHRKRDLFSDRTLEVDIVFGGRMWRSSFTGELAEMLNFKYLR